jgi:AraC-like DNA-binding protein
VNRYTTLLETPDLSLRRFDHPPHEAHEDPDEEVSQRWTIAFVRSGAFEVVASDEMRCGVRQRLVAGSVLLTHPGQRLRCRHDEEWPDDVCLSIAFRDAVASGAEYAWARAGWMARERPTPRLALVQRRLARAGSAADPFDTERWALAALTALESDSLDARARGHYMARARDIELVMAACREIEREPEAHTSIAARAKVLGIDGGMLTRAFRRYLGVSPHRYVIRCRLVAATRRLDEGASVSDAALGAGFENLSHFCRSFRRTLGARPSAWRSLAPAERRRKVQAILAGRP